MRFTARGSRGLTQIKREREDASREFGRRGARRPNSLDQSRRPLIAAGGRQYEVKSSGAILPQWLKTRPRGARLQGVFGHARTAALQAAATLDVHAIRQAKDKQDGIEGKKLLADIVRMLVAWERSLQEE